MKERFPDCLHVVPDQKLYSMQRLPLTLAQPASGLDGPWTLDPLAWKLMMPKYSPTFLPCLLVSASQTSSATTHNHLQSFTMRPSFTSLVTAAIAVAGTALALPASDSILTAVQRAADADTAAGFLSATFLGDVPHVFLHYSRADAPVTFSAVSGSKGELVPTLGTGGARDPYIFRNQVNGKVSARFKHVGRFAEACH